MSAMSQQIQIVEDLVPFSEPSASNDRLAGQSRLHAALRLLASTLLAPLLVILAVPGFVIVLVDFAFFRFRDHRAGHPGPKALWEF